jgi:hypothetical protein
MVVLTMGGRCKLVFGNLTMYGEYDGNLKLTANGVAAWIGPPYGSF